jgi:serine/threonine protein kinase
MMSILPPVTRQRAMSFEEIEEEYQERQERGTIHVDSGAEDSSSDNSDGDSDGDDSVTMPEISPRFVVERALGKGACGLVVRARDTLPPPPLQQYSAASASLSGSCGLNTDDGNGPSITSSGVSVAGGGGGGGGEGGGGGYGTVAIKRVRNVFSGGSNNARSLLNEVRLLRCLGGGGGRSLSSAEHEIGDNISDEDGDEGGITSQNKSRRHRDGSGGGGGHRHITALYGLLRLPGESSKEVFDSVYLILEPCDSDLFKVLNSSAKLSSKQVRSLLKQVLQALAWLALHNVCHSDVKPGNLLVNRDGSLRLADFGLASVVAAAVAPPSAPPQAFNSHGTAAGSTTGIEIATGVEVASAVVFDTSALIGSTSTVAPSSANLSVLESSNNSGSSSSSSSNSNSNNSNNNSSTDNDAPATLALVRSASTETTAVSTAAAISTTAATFSIAASSIGIPPSPGVLFRRTSSSPTFNRLKPGFSGNGNIGDNNGNNTGRANHGLVGAGGGVGGCGGGGGGCGGGGMMRRRGSPRPLYDSTDSPAPAAGGG